MKKTLIVVILLILGNMISFSQSAFNDSILLSKQRNIVFVIRICHNDVENKYIIHRAYPLYRFISQDCKLDFRYDSKYKEHIGTLIRKKECLTVPPEVVIPDYFKKVIDSEEVDSVAKYGKEIFIDYFFKKNGYIKNEKYKYQYAIANQLFEWDVVLKFDTYSGSMYIEEMLKEPN